MIRHWPKLLIIISAVIILLPLLTHDLNPFYGAPDYQYVKAKVLWVQRGELFDDPVTGIPTLHPFLYHLILAGLVKIGFGIDRLLWLMPIAIVAGIYLFAYVILRRLFSEPVSCFTVFLLPFLFQYMGPGNLLLPTSFYFSLPIFLAGLYVHLSPKPSTKTSIAVGLLWGLAYLLSPVYFFVIGLALLYDLLVKRIYRCGLLTISALVLAIVPFLIQIYIVGRAGLGVTSTFQIWRGIPKGDWLYQFLTSLLSPADGRIRLLPIACALLVVMTGAIGVVTRKARSPLVLITVIGFILTAYHFNFAYSSRIWFIVSLLLAGYGVDFLRRYRVPRLITPLLTLLLGTTALYHNHLQVHELYSAQAKYSDGYRIIGSTFWQNIGQYIEPETFILASDVTYRFYIMPIYPVHSLLAYKTGEYFQLNSIRADEVLRDYNLLMVCTDSTVLNQLCDKYHISTAVAKNPEDVTLPVFGVIAADWILIYQDQYFRIYSATPGAARIDPS